MSRFTGVALILATVPMVVPPGLRAQAFSVFAGRSVLQYNAQNDQAFGGWRLAALLGLGDEIGVQASAAWWSNLRDGPESPDGDGHDLAGSLRYRAVGSSRFSVGLEAGLGTFTGPRSLSPDGERAGGTLIFVGLNLIVVPISPLGLEVGGYFRDDGGSFDLEGRFGLRAWIARGKSPEVVQQRIAIGTTQYYELGGVTSGDGFGLAFEFERRYGNIGGLVALDVVPVRIEASNQTGFYDSSVILFWGGPRFRSGWTRTLAPFLTAGPLVAAYLEGPLSGLKVGGGAEAGLEFQKRLNGVALTLAPSARFVAFDGTSSGAETAVVWRFSAGLRF